MGAGQRFWRLPLSEDSPDVASLLHCGCGFRWGRPFVSHDVKGIDCQCDTSLLMLTPITWLRKCSQICSIKLPLVPFPTGLCVAHTEWGHGSAPLLWRSYMEFLCMEHLSVILCSFNHLCMSLWIHSHFILWVNTVLHYLLCSSNCSSFGHQGHSSPAPASLMCPCQCLFALLNLWHHKCWKLILYAQDIRCVHFFSPRISHFSKESWILVSFTGRHY
jgi:hypothetical protein